MPPDVAAFFHVNVVPGAPKNDHPLDRSLASQRVIDVFLQRNDRAAAIAAIRGDDRDRAAIGDPIANALGAEAAEDHRVHRADPRAGQHGDRRFRNRRHIDDDAVAFADSVSLQDVREAADIAMQLLVGQRAFFARFAFPEDRRLVSVRPVEMPVEAILGDVQFPADEPFRERRLPFEHLFPRLLPDQLVGLRAPRIFPGDLIDSRCIRR